MTKYLLQKFMTKIYDQNRSKYDKEELKLRPNTNSLYHFQTWYLQFRLEFL